MMVKFTEKHRWGEYLEVYIHWKISFYWRKIVLFWLYFDAKYVLCVCAALLRSFTHFLTGVCAIIGGVFTGQPPLSDGVLKRHFSLLTWLIFSLLLHSCSGWSDRLAHLPLGSGHPEEDRAGQGVLTAPPSPLSLPTWPPAVQHRPGHGHGDRLGGQTEREKSAVGLNGRQRGFKSAEFLIPLSLFLLWINAKEELVGPLGIFLSPVLFGCQKDAVWTRRWQETLMRRSSVREEDASWREDVYVLLPSTLGPPRWVWEDLWSALEMRRLGGFLKEHATQNLFLFVFFFNQLHTSSTHFHISQQTQ